MFDFTVELRQGDHGDVELLGEDFQVSANSRYFLLPILFALTWATHQLQVIYNDQTKAVIELDARGAGADVQRG